MIDNLLVALTLALASGRIAYLISKDEITRPAREWVFLRSAPLHGTILNDEGNEMPARYVHRDENGDADLDVAKGPRPLGFWGRLVECPFCTSFWVSLAAAIGWLIFGYDIIYVAIVPALWAAANLYAKALSE